MHRSVRLGAVIGATLTVLALAIPADASSTATARISDRYHHGWVKVRVDGTTHKIGPGRHTRAFTVEPSPSRNDGVSVSSLRYRGCGEGSVGWYFRAGHRYKITIVGSSDRCSIGNGKYVPGPHFRITKIS